MEGSSFSGPASSAPRPRPWPCSWLLTRPGQHSPGRRLLKHAPWRLRCPELDEFLRPLRVDAKLVHQLSREFGANFQQLAAESTDQFLATPISESVLRPRAGKSTAGKSPPPSSLPETEALPRANACLPI